MNEINRLKWSAGLVNSFHDSLRESIKELSWEEKAHFIESLIEFVGLIQKNDNLEAAKIYDIKFLRALKHKLQNSVSSRLFEHFDKDLAWMLLGIIPKETFNSLPGGQQGMSDREYELFLSSTQRIMHNLRHMLYIYESKHADSVPIIDDLTHPLDNPSGDLLKQKLVNAKEEASSPIKSKSDNLPGNDETFTIKQLANYLGCSLVSIHSYKKKGLPFYRIGRKILFKRTDVLSYMDQKPKKNKSKG